MADILISCCNHVLIFHFYDSFISIKGCKHVCFDVSMFHCFMIKNHGSYFKNSLFYDKNSWKLFYEVTSLYNNDYEVTSLNNNQTTILKN